MNFGNFSYKILDEIVAMNPVAVYFRKNSHLVEVFNRKLRMLKAAGLVEYWTNKFLEKKYLRVKDEPKGPKKLNLKTLSGGFGLVVLGWLISFLVFAYEVTKVKFKMLFKLIKTFSHKIYLLPFVIKLLIRKVKGKLQ